MSEEHEGPITEESIAIEERQRKVFEEYFTRGRKKREIASKLGVHVNTIYNDIKAIKKELANYSSRSVHEMTGEIIENFKIACNEAWHKFKTTLEPIDKARFLNLFVKTHKELSIFLLDAGIIKRAPTVHQVSMMKKEMSAMETEDLEEFVKSRLDKLGSNAYDVLGIKSARRN